MASLTSLQSALGYVFQDKTLLGQALTHRSHGVPHNERLEFLGDSVLNFVVTTLLFAEHVEMDEGDLSRVRANLVKQAALAEIAQRLELSGHLRLGEGELKSGGFRRPSILADALEALFGAIYIDGGYPAVRDVIERLYRPILAHIDIRTFGKDPKTLLQEIVQGRGLNLPHYEVLATHGAAHSQLFDVECRIEKLGVQVTASGSSRRAAEQLAASQAIATIAELAPARKGARRSRKPAQLSLPVAVAQKEP